MALVHAIREAGRARLDAHRLTLEYVGNRNSFTSIELAMHRWGGCIHSLRLASTLLSSIKYPDIKDSESKLRSDTLGLGFSIFEDIALVDNGIKHFDERISQEGGAGYTSTVPLWITNDGLCGLAKVKGELTKKLIEWGALHGLLNVYISHCVKVLESKGPRVQK